MKKLQDILDHVDPSEIADICQAGDSRTEKRLYSRIEMHLQNPEEELLVPAQEHTHGIAWQRIVMTAACLTIVGGAGTAAVLLSHPQHVSQGSQEAAEQARVAEPVGVGQRHQAGLEASSIPPGYQIIDS